MGIKNKIGYLLIAFGLLPVALLAQEPKIDSVVQYPLTQDPLAQDPSLSTTTEQQLEAITESNDDNETEDDSYLQQLTHYLKEPINLNTADATTLKDLMILSPTQIQSILSYRNLFGKFVDIYELQAIPYWDIRTIQKLRPFVTVSSNVNVATSIWDRLHGGTNTVLVRASEIAEESKGYQVDPASGRNYYPGSRQRLFVRYKYQYKNLLEFGVAGDKDAGEQFFKGNQTQGFDFYSAHVFARNLGMIKALALGDFTVNLGQGLVQWQSLAFKKSVDVTNIKRMAPVLKPYSSAGEIVFHRGAGITIGKKNIEATAFVSYRKLDGNFVAADTLTGDDEEGNISSLLTSGYHRTKSEVEDKGTITQLTYGGNVAYNKNNFHIGVNGVQYKFGLPLTKTKDPYNLYAFDSLKNFGNYSVDYSYTYKNVHFFGEAATTNRFDKAFVNGLMLSISSNIDMSFLYRNISKSYQSLYTNAFTESSIPNNEKGFYSGISVRPNLIWRIDAYADFYKSEWLKYQLDAAPTTGVDYLLQATYKPNKQLELYFRYRTETKSQNENPDNIFPMAFVVPKPSQKFRVQLSYKISPSVTLKDRVELAWFDKRGSEASNGFLAYADIVYKPMMKKYSGNLRLQYFETDNYDSRIYAYENDVLYYYSIGVFSGKGFRYYVNLNYDFSKRLSAWLKWSQTIYPKNSVIIDPIGSGLDEINGRHKSEIRLQLQYIF